MQEKRWHRFYDKHVPKHIEYPNWCIFELLDRSTVAYPQNIATFFFGRKLLYWELASLTNSFAKSLQQLGIDADSKVALLLPNFPGYLIAYYGILKTGAVVVPLNPLYAEEELEYQLSDSGVSALVTIPQFASKACKLAQKLRLKFVVISSISAYLPWHLRIPFWFKEKAQLKEVDVNVPVYFLEKLVSKKYIDFKPVRKDPSELGVLIYSGGTTGVAKGIMLSHFAVVANAMQIAAWGDLNSNERILAVLPLFHGYGMNVCMNAPIYSGMSIILLPRFNPKLMAKTIHKYKPTMTAVVPTILTALANLPDISRYNFTSLKAVWVGAAPLTEATKDEFEKKAKCKVIEGYGLTEAVTAQMANPYKGVHKVGSIGIPFPDVDAKIVSLEDGVTEMPPNTPGEIVLKTPTVMMGYFNKPEATEEVLKDGWLYTGDIGYMDDDGYFYITDRKKDLIIVGGFNVFPSEVDEVLYKHPKVKEGITVGIPDPYKGEKIKVYVVLKEGVEATEEEFIEFFRKHLAPYKVPSEVEFRKELPKSAIGKILRKVLREEEIKKMKEPDGETAK
ncbi:long-chain acyl-CoA synthetase [Thermosulfidibacter takaii ABI70S6]|uniref:Long-chain acyl-CoA synthetase n=1 Tax=Thermosulfidibacter takaii (strain DSM 17441 / JCM 13301 / NBRC 103674 / ABI70S6) TaxID=1298851 RepID=A0A0S3QRM5_THET7|nr:long-chain fatty acid--CoA ligase [Thermosulfidibacter takaii]BAT70992.1 long-chain acyl-CoA synthetase [Thermosulfidibacter takaii ABI70S6]